MQVNSESVNNSHCNASGNFVDTKSTRNISNKLQQQFDLEFADITLSNLRPPQASSTVERKVMRSTGTRFMPENSPINDYSNCWSERQSEDRLLTASAGESSLGLIDVSTLMKDQSRMNNTTINIETERELARQLLLRCSQRDNNPALYDTNKENNVNIQNLSATEEGKTSLPNQVSKFNSTTVSFEPTEFTGRSSIINEDGVTSSTSVLSSFKANNSNAYGFSFNSTAAELMEKFGNDDFLSGSQFDNKLLTDELSWRQNYDVIPPSATTIVPVASTNCVNNTNNNNNKNNNNNNNNNNYNNRKEHLNLTCFSGIIGELDLSLASCATATSGGRKVSVGEYFKRKCDPLGQLSNSTISSIVDRPNFGLHSIRSPERIASYKSPVNGGEMASTLNGTVDVESESFSNNTMVNSCDETQLSKTTVADDLMSLSKIAQVLQSDELGGSPRRLIDQLLMLKKKQKSDNLSMLSSKTIMPGGGDTYTVLPARTSLPVMNSTSSTTLVAGASDNDAGIKSNGLSFDNKSVNGVIKNDFDSFNDKNHFNNDSDVAKALFPSTKDVVDASESYKNSKGIKIIKTSILSPAESPLSKYKLLNHNSMQNNIKQNNSGRNDDDDNNNALLENIRQRHDQYQQHQQQNNMVIKQELDYTNYEKRVSEKISIGKNTRDLYKCLIGVPRDADIEIKNESDRWLICTFKLDQIQGNKNNVEIIVPSDQILIEPNESKTAKLMVNFLKFGDPVMASLSIQVMDMSTREIFTKQHMMCFIPTINDEFKNQDLTCSSTSILTTTTTTTQVTGATATANGDCHREIELIDATPVLLKINTNKYIRLKNKTNKMVNLSVAVEPFDKLPEDNFNIEPKNLTLQIDEMSIVLIKYHSSTGIKLNDRQAVINIKTDGNIYSYSAVLIENEKNEKENEDEEGRGKNREEKDKDRESNKVGVDNENNDYCQRCNTPQRMMFTGASGTGGTRAGSVELGASGDIVNDAGLSPSNNILSPASTASIGTTIVPRINLSGRNSPRSTISTTTSNTGGSRPPTAVTDDVIIPIKSTNSTLVWTTVKVGKYENREFTIRNIGSSKIKLQGVITDKDNCYKFLKDRDSSTNMTVTLQRMESKTFTVIFNPSSVGPAAGKITFTYFDKKQHQQQQNNDNNNKELSRPSRIIPLYGYGGYAKVCVGQALKIIGDQMWLPLGKLNSNGTLNTKIRLENTGDLSAYAKISLAPKAVYPSVESNWHIEPTEVILAPKEVQWITLRFRPRREDMALLRGATASGVRGGCGNSTGNVTDIATLTIMHGDEPTRWRIRRLYKKITQAEQVKKSKDSKDIFMSMVHQISKVITGEKSINNLNIIRDSVQDLGILCRQLSRHAITLTMEWDSDDTMSIYQDTDDYYYDDDDDSNESKLFQSLYSASEINNCTAITVTNENNSYYLPSASETRYLTDANYITRANNNQPIPSSSSSSVTTSMRNPVTDVSIDVEADKNKQFTVSPLSVTLSPPILKHATVIITNMTSNNQPYRTKLLSHSELVSVVPSEGLIPARRGILVKIQSNNNNSVDKNIEAVLRIYTANEKRDLAIKILTAASVPSTEAGGASAHGRTESGS